MIYFKENLEILMERYNISGERLGSQIGLTRGAISSYVTGGAYPKVDKLLMIALILKVDLNDFFYKDLTKIDNLDIGQIGLNNTEGCLMAGGCILRRVAVMESDLLKLKNDKG
jgi:transcriptional regulator with XRE-family HTH domain